MEQETLDHLRVAEQNRDHVLSLLAPAAAVVQPRRWEWAGVVAFYSAVHYANAYLWEFHRFAPQLHSERTRAFHTERPLRSAGSSYGFLRTYGYEARYETWFVADEVVARELIEVDLRAVEAAVLQSLGLPVPGWKLPPTGP